MYRNMSNIIVLCLILLYIMCIHSNYSKSKFYNKLKERYFMSKKIDIKNVDLASISIKDVIDIETTSKISG